MSPAGWNALWFVIGLLTGPALLCAHFLFMEWKYGVPADSYYPTDPYLEHLDHIEECEFCKRSEDAA